MLYTDQCIINRAEGPTQFHYSYILVDVTYILIEK